MERRIFIGLAASALLFTSPAFAQQASNIASAPPDAIRLYVTNAIKTPLEAVRADAEKAIGKPIVIDYGSARGNLRTAILAGQGDFEIAMLLPDVDYELLKAGKIKPKRFEISRVDVAVALRGDVTPPDVSTPEALKQALLKASSVKYAPTGAALNTVRKVIGDLKLQGLIKDTSAVRDPVVLGPGEYELNLYPVSEILINKSLRNLGAVVAPLQAPVIITGTIGKNARNLKATKALIAYLQGPAFDAPLTTSGMMKGEKGEKPVPEVAAP